MTRPHLIPGETVTFAVKNRSGKKNIASYLASRLGVVDAWAAVLVQDGHVALNGRAAAPGDTINLSAGPHSLSAFIPHDWPRHMKAVDMPLDFLHRDDHLAVLNKPAGIVVHPARGHLDGRTLQNGMRHRYRHLLDDPATCIGSPHRLDQDTSGAIVFALDRPTYAALVAQFSTGQPHKEYLAVVDGSPDFTDLSCREPIGMDPAQKGKGAVVPCADGGKAARTDFSVVERGRGWALLRAVPFTGRPHQIRLHAASLGLPLAGDDLYNPAPRRVPFPRQALHASALSFIHPASALPLRVEAPLPQDFLSALERLRDGEL